MGMTFQSQPQHGQALGIGRAGLLIFQWRLAAGHKENRIEPELLQRVAGKKEMAVMHRIERPAINAQPKPFRFPARG
jgi:hypothetical protein